jgi:hypothetical protein
MKHLQMSVNQDCLNKALWSNDALPEGVIDFPYMYIVKPLKNLLLKNPKS